MATYDVVIRGGSLIDGTGATARSADIGIRADRIVQIGNIDSSGEREIDAAGRVVAPGFVDIHTHYDAQVFWDGMLSPSPYHGVTSVVGGNCGFSIAPLSAEAADYLVHMLARVEGMPLESLLAGVPWNWRSFGEYLARIDGKVAVNAGFMVGHSALRRVVMGERAVGERATDAELAAMVELLRRSLGEGGLGFSSTISISHNDADGRPVPSRHASREELIALARAVRDYPGTTLEFLPGVEPFDEERMALMTDLSLAARRPLNWNALGVTADNGDYVRQQLGASDYARERGARVVALTTPQSGGLRVNFVSGFVLDMLPGWDALFRLPLAERRRELSDPAGRRRLQEGAAIGLPGPMSDLSRFDRIEIRETFAPANARFQGRTCGDVAAELGKPALDVMLDVALADDLRTSFLLHIGSSAGGTPADWQARGRVWADERVLIGASDAGAHLDMIDSFAIPTRVLANGVREHRLLGLEQAVHLLTDRPARLIGLRERGRIAPGWKADVVVFDPATVDCEPVHTRADLPGGGSRLYAGAAGICHVLVNGVEIVRDGADTGARPGTVLRSGRDTETVEVGAR
ncbi:MAG: amidohydrolase family protein [Gammaproteobacteria bacterium]